jgi:hypothetical protein
MQTTNSGKLCFDPSMAHSKYLLRLISWMRTYSKTEIKNYQQKRFLSSLFGGEGSRVFYS